LQITARIIDLCNPAAALLTDLVLTKLNYHVVCLMGETK
jgi:hypothetical protein